MVRAWSLQWLTWTLPAVGLCHWMMTNVLVIYVSCHLSVCFAGIFSQCLQSDILFSSFSLTNATVGICLQPDHYWAFHISLLNALTLLTWHQGGGDILSQQSPVPLVCKLLAAKSSHYWQQRQNKSREFIKRLLKLTFCIFWQTVFSAVLHCVWSTGAGICFLITHGTEWPILCWCAVKQLLTHTTGADLLFFIALILSIYPVSADRKQAFIQVLHDHTHHTCTHRFNGHYPGKP